MKLTLQKSFFDYTEKELLTHGSITVRSLRYPSGVEALKVSGTRLSFVFTPFKGQQIWHLAVDGNDISMQTTVAEPQSSMTYLENYGGFLYHCGVMSFGVPDAVHPQHGEIPNAIYDSAYVECGCDSLGKYVDLGGSLMHNTAFIRQYRFSPTIRLYENATVLKVNVRLENLRAYPMEYMYLCHVNFRPFEGAKLYTTAKKDPEHFMIYKSDANEALRSYISRLEEDLSIAESVDKKSQCYDPELCFGITHTPDENGRAHTIQYTDSGACYVSHPTDALPYAIRWISRTQNEDSMGMVLPATGEHLGYEHAKNKGQIKILGANETLEFTIEAGYLDAPEAKAMKEKIERINNL